MTHFIVYLGISAGAVLLASVIAAPTGVFIAAGLSILAASGGTAALGQDVMLRTVVAIALVAALVGMIRHPARLAAGVLLVFAAISGSAVAQAWNRETDVFRTVHLAYWSIIAGISCALAVVINRWSEMVQRLRERVREYEQYAVRLSAANVDLQDYAVVSGRKSAEAERLRISREIHDTVGHTLVAITMMTEAISDSIDVKPTVAKRILGNLRESAERGLEDTRRAVRSYRDTVSERYPLPSAIHKLCETFGSASQVHIEIQIGGLQDHYSPQVDATVFRFVQEALTNAFRHGHANEVLVLFAAEEGKLRVTVIDNGIGSSGGDAQPGVGLKGMEERLQQIGGRLTTTSLPTGFVLTAEIPL